MKRIVILLAAIPMLFLQSCDTERFIGIADLPEKAATFIQNNFPSADVISVVKDYDDLSYTYDVVLSDGTMIEFKRSGEWKDVDARTSKVPDAIVPADILNYVQTNYEGNYIVDISRDIRYDVELDNKRELVFALTGTYLGVDF
ncbi:MAG: PepSY-like domain-containing protein [Tidjanibacter sp.]|nr:PepSY-like domain-containing protein [Tidjanibacter sp.]